ncbi:MAG: MOSC domain-containing protein [Methanobacterium sp.]|mgnify:CR=1 FL=1|jgi:MOSC domain-containing protein YiiM
MNSSVQVIAVSTSEVKHQKKINVDKGVLKENFGIIGDVHGDSNTHRQISLLSIESIGKMRDLGLNVNPGDFGENITTKGIDLPSIPVGTRLSVGGDILLEVTQIGKECLEPCAIGREVGKCVMPIEGIFARVIKGGEVKAGDKIEVLKN